MKTDTKENLKEKQIKKQQGLCGMICHVIYLELKHCPVICIISILLTIGTGVCTAANVFFKQNFYDSTGENYNTVCSGQWDCHDIVFSVYTGSADSQ